MRTLILGAVIVVSAAVPAFGRDRGTPDNSGHIVHSRRGAVILHRAVPPFHGVHVYEKPTK